MHVWVLQAAILNGLPQFFGHFQFFLEVFMIVTCSLIC